MNVLIRKAILSDIEDIKQLADSHRYEIGFIRRASLVRSIERREMLVVTNSTKMLGFVDYHHRRDAQTTLYHIVVVPDHRYEKIGALMFQKLAREAKALRKEFIQLKCPAELPANKFYESIGCRLLREEEGNSRKLQIWQSSIYRQG